MNTPSIVAPVVTAKNVKKMFAPFLLAALMTGCAGGNGGSFMTPETSDMAVIAFPEKIPQGEIIEDAIEVAQTLHQFPGASKIDKENGIVEFGLYGHPMMGVTSQVRVKAPGKLEITVVRWSRLAPIKVDKDIAAFVKGFNAKLGIHDATVAAVSPRANTDNTGTAK